MVPGTHSLWIPLPPPGCQPHAKGHWRPKAAATKAYREEARLYGLASRLRFTTPVRISPTWFMGPTLDKRYRPLDIGNSIAALKAAVDGLVDAKVLRGDTHRDVQWGECKLLRSRKEYGANRPGVVLMIEGLE